MYADDCSFTVLDLKSVSKILNIAHIYDLATGAKLNKMKSWALYVCKWGDIQKKLYGIQWRTGMFKICGGQL